MSHNNLRGQSSSFVKERQVLEPEASCEDHVVKRSRSGRKIKETNLRVRKYCSLNGPLEIKSRRRCRRGRRILKVPQIPDKIFNLVNILQHENFLQAVDQVFKQTANKQRRKKTQPKKSGAIEKSDFKPAVPNPIDFDSNTL